MPVSTLSLETLSVKLVGEASGYKKVLREAGLLTKKVAKEIGAVTKKITREQNQVLQQTAQNTKATLASTKAYVVAVKNLSRRLKQGLISQDTYNRALKEAKATLPSTKEAVARLNRELAKNARAAKVAAVAQAKFLGALSLTKLKAFGTGLQSVGRRMRSVGLMMGAAITLPVIAMVKSFASFDDAMTKSLAIMGDISPELRKEMEETARTLSLTTVTSATQAAEAYFFLASAGLNAEQSIAALAVVEKFAVAGAFDMARATDLLTDAQSALGLTVQDSAENMKNMTRVSDILVKANTLANATVQQFSEALTNTAGAAINQYNMGLEESVAILAVYADQGLKGATAGSMFGRMIRLLIKSINDNNDAFTSLGINTEEFAATGKNVTEIIRGITKATEGMGPAQKAATLEMLGFEARIQQAILPLLGMTDQMEAYEKAILKAGGTTKEVADKQLSSFTSQMIITWNWVKDLAFEIGEELAPHVETLGMVIRDLVKWFKELSPWMKTTTALIIGLGAVIGPVVFALGALGIAIGGVTTFFTLAVPAIAGFALALKPLIFTITAVTIALDLMGVTGAKAGVKTSRGILKSTKAIAKIAKDAAKETKVQDEEAIKRARTVIRLAKEAVQQKEAEKKALKLIEAARSPVEVIRDQMKELQKLFDLGGFDKTGGKPFNKIMKQLQEALAAELAKPMEAADKVMKTLLDKISKSNAEATREALRQASRVTAAVTKQARDALSEGKRHLAKIKQLNKQEEDAKKTRRKDLQDLIRLGRFFGNDKITGAARKELRELTKQENKAELKRILDKRAGIEPQRTAIDKESDPKTQALIEKNKKLKQQVEDKELAAKIQRLNELLEQQLTGEGPARAF